MRGSVVVVRTAMASEEPVADFKCRRLGAASV
jgi:hypothetical protein